MNNLTMTNQTISVSLVPSNDVLEFLFVSSTDATSSTAATVEASSTTAMQSTSKSTTSQVTTSSSTTTSTQEITSTSPSLESVQVEIEIQKTTSPPLVTTELMMTTEKTTAATLPAVKAEELDLIAEETISTTLQPSLTAEEEVEMKDEETIDWSSFANEIEGKIKKKNMLDMVEDAAPAEEETTNIFKSFYSCTSLSSDEAAISSLGTVMVLEYDYDLTTVDELDETTLSSLEMSITENLADNYGLTACRRRQLRGLKADVNVLALDANPADLNVADTSKCNENVDLSFSCTPISGYITAYVEEENDVEAVETELLSHIEKSMASGIYNEANIINTSYIGSRTTNNIIEDTNVPVTKEVRAAFLKEKEPPLFVISFLALLVGFAAVVLLCEFFTNKKKKGIKEPCDDEIVEEQTKPDIEKVHSVDATVDLSVKDTAAELPDDDMYANIASITLSSSSSGETSSGDDGDYMQYAMTEDYSDLDRRGSCLAAIASNSNLIARTFSPPKPKRYLSTILSPVTSVDDDSSYDVDYGTTLDSIPL